MKSKNNELSVAHVQAAINGDLNALRSVITTENVNTVFSINVNTPTGLVPQNATLLCLAAQNGHTAMVQWLIEKNANVNVAGVNGNTPLMSAIANNKPETVGILLDAMAVTDIDYKNSAGETAVSMACFYGTASMLKALIDKGANLSTPETNGAYPINYAAQLGKSDVLTLLVEGGADINTKEPGGTTPLIASIAKGQPHAAARLIELGANVNISNVSGLYPVHYAALNGDLATLKLLATDYNVNQPALVDHRATPLYLAAQSGHAEVVRWLRAEKDADASLVGAQGMTPLYTAIVHHKSETASALIELGAKYNIPNITGFFPIHAAAEFGDTATIGLLYEAGCDADLKAVNPLQQTPMHVAFIKAQMEVINCLLESGADINVQTTEGKTPLHLLLENQSIEAETKVQIVKSHVNEFDLSIADKEGKTVFQYAEEYCAECVAELAHNSVDFVMNASAALTVIANSHEAQYEAQYEALPVEEEVDALGGGNLYDGAADSLQ